MSVVNGVTAGFLGSLAAGLATGIGALPILARGRPGKREAHILLGFATGIMLAASFFSLILPALGSAEAQGLGPWTRSVMVTGFVLAGGACLAGLNRTLPSLETIAGGRFNDRHRPTWFLIFAICLHNVPEGAAVGLSFGGGNLASGMPTALGIGIQNIPEGLAVAGALAAIGYGRRIAALGGLLSGLIEPIAGLASALLLTAAAILLPAGLALAAGAMLYIVVAQMLPEITTGDDGSGGIVALFVGLGVMLTLDTALA